MGSSSLKDVIDRVFGGVILSVVIALIYLVISGLFLRAGVFAKVVRIGNFEYAFLLVWLPVAAFVLGAVIGLGRSTHLLGVIFGTNKSTSRMATISLWLFFLASCFLFFYQQ